MDVNKLSIISLDSISCFNNADQLEFVMDELQEGNINNTQEKVDITGKAGRKIGSIKRNKAVVVTATNGLLVGGALSAQTGSAVEHGTFKVRRPEIVVVKSNTATLVDGVPVGEAGNEIKFAYIRSESGSISIGEANFVQDATVSAGKFTYTDKTLTFNEGDVEDGTEIVVFYDVEVSAAKISNDSETYSKVLKMYIDVTLTDPCDNLFYGQFIVPRADFSGEFDIAMGNDPSVHAIEAESLAGGCGGQTKFWDLIVFGVNDK